MSNEKDSTAPSTATDGSPGGPGDEGSLSSPPPAGPPGAVPNERPPYVELTLRVYVDLNAPLPETLVKRLDQGFSYWEDGRRHFSTELVEEGLSRLLRTSLDKAIEDKHRKIYGDETVPTPISGGNGETWNRPRYVIEAEPEIFNTRARIYSSIECVEAKLISEEELWARLRER